MNALNALPAEKPLTSRAAAKQRTRRLALAIARRLFLEHGYEKATLRSIATEMGMSTGAIFCYFDSKEDLFGAVAEAERAAYATAADEYVVRHARPDRRQPGRYMAAVLDIDYEPDRLALLRIETALSWSSGPMQGLLDRRREFLYELFMRHVGWDRSVRLYLSYAWSMHLEKCRSTERPYGLEEEIDLITCCLKGDLDSP